MSPFLIKPLLFNSFKISSKIFASLGAPECINMETGINLVISNTTVTLNPMKCFFSCRMTSF